MNDGDVFVPATHPFLGMLLGTFQCELARDYSSLLSICLHYDPGTQRPMFTIYFKLSPQGVELMVPDELVNRVEDQSIDAEFTNDLYELLHKRVGEIEDSLIDEKYPDEDDDQEGA